MELIDGNKTAETIINELREKVSALPGNIVPKVVFIRVGEDPASVSYVNKKSTTAEKIGIKSELIVFPESVTRDELYATIDRLNKDTNVHGILIQAPLPKHIPETETFNRVDPDKDVDGFNTLNIGKLCQEDPSAFVACTPAGIVELLRRANVETRGKHVIVVGRSLIVGKPAALLMVRKALPGDATVTICHSRTTNLADICRQGDIIIAAIGRAHTITADMVKPGAVVIDVGINRIPDSTKKSGFRLVGDVDFDKVAPIASKITPVPGGVGPMTVALLMANTYRACMRAHKREE